MKQTNIKRGDVFWVELDPAKDTEIQKTRPALIISHDLMNEKLPRVIVAPITSNVNKVFPLFEHLISGNDLINGKIMFHQIRTVDKSRLGKKISTISIQEMAEMDTIIKLILGIQ